jgi:twinkle protein
VLDPWNDLEDSRPNGMTETEFIHGALRKIRTFARNHECHVWIVAHPRKLMKEGGKYPVATPYDIAGSAGFYNKSDNCLSLWRDMAEEMRPVELHVQKIKFHEIGGLGKVLFRHERLTGRYYETIDR